MFSARRVELLSELHKRFEPARQELLESRKLPPLLGLNPKTATIRNTEWICPLLDSVFTNGEVEITGPPLPLKMPEKAMHCGADVYMADFEDSLSPTWENIVEGHRNVQTIQIGQQTTTLFVRPRGMHLNEDHMFGMSASLFDFGMFTCNTSRPYFYLPKIEHYKEARWWAEVFRFTEDWLAFPRRSIKCSVLIETHPAVYQMDEIIWELKDYIVGLNAGRWDYIFSFIKTRPESILGDRSKITMQSPFMAAYTSLLVKTCNKRGITPIGGMSAYVPSKNKEENEIALEEVRQDKVTEGSQGFSRTWVAHPGLVDIAREALIWGRRVSSTSNQSNIDYLSSTTAEPEITSEGIRANISVALEYIANWLSGTGCIKINGKMEDAATAEISRIQVWQWLHQGQLTIDEFDQHLGDVYTLLAERWVKDIKYLNQAETIFVNLTSQFSCNSFLTTEAYKILLENTDGQQAV